MEGHHLGHAGDAMLGERARDDRTLRVGQAHVQAPGVRHLGLDVEVGATVSADIDAVLAIDTATNQVIATIPVGYADGLRRSPPWRVEL